MKAIAASQLRTAFVRAPNCEGAYCCDPGGEARVYPLLFAASVMLCHHCWERENHYRQQRGKELGCPEHWLTRNWDAAERYQPVETNAISAFDLPAGRRFPARAEAATGLVALRQPDLPQTRRAFSPQVVAPIHR
jgi:hypothetical protein